MVQEIESQVSRNLKPCVDFCDIVRNPQSAVSDSIHNCLSVKEPRPSNNYSTLNGGV